MPLITIARYAGNVLIMSGYFVLVNYHVEWGLAIRLAGGLLLLPFGIKAKLWDFLGVVGFFLAVDSSALLGRLL